MGKVSKYSNILGVKSPDNGEKSPINHQKNEINLQNHDPINKYSNYAKSIWPHETPPHLEPRPDLGNDSSLWQGILHNALQLDPDPDRKNYGLLHGIRCLGAYVEFDRNSNPRKLKLTRGEIPEGEWGEIKTSWLGKQAEDIKYILSTTAELGLVETKVAHNAPWWVQVEVVELDGSKHIVGPGSAEVGLVQRNQPKAEQQTLF